MKFYREHFIFSNPEDTRLELVSRAVGIDWIIDEFVFHCTHDRMTGCKPTRPPLPRNYGGRPIDSSARTEFLASHPRAAVLASRSQAS